MKAKINSPQRFFMDLDKHNIPYVVLRWHSEIPSTPEEIEQFIAEENDIDILIEQGHENKLISILASNRGELDVDIYSDTGRKGFSFNGYPYYPVGMAKSILQTRVKKNNFYIPSPQMHTYSLIYHLVYHKGLESGISTGVDGIETKSKKDKHNTLQSINKILEDSKVAPAIPKDDFTLTKLYNILSKNEWLMPTDLLRRLDNIDEFHEHLLSKEERNHTLMASKLPETMVFLLRDDADSIDDRNICREELKKHFEIIEEHPLMPVQAERLCQHTRGGNWYEVSGTKLVKPSYIFVCYDHSPEATPSNNILAQKHPHVSNNKTFIKYEIRDTLKERNTPKTVGLHSSDNALEAFEMIHTTYSSEADRINNMIESTIKNHHN